MYIHNYFIIFKFIKNFIINLLFYYLKKNHYETLFVKPTLLDAFNDPSIIDEKTLSLTREVQFNGNDGELCTAEFEYSAERDGIIFDIRLGECGMSAESVEKDDNKYIKFSQHFSFAQPPPNDFRVC